MEISLRKGKGGTTKGLLGHLKVFGFVLNVIKK